MTELNIPSGEFDMIASIGKKCQPAGRLKRLGLRSFSGPFDWFASQKMPEITKVIENGTDHLFLKENLKINGIYKDCLDVTDTKTGFRSIHDIPDTALDSGAEEAVLEMKHKISRRFDKFIKSLESADRALLVRLNATHNSIVKLRSVLDAKFPSTEITILVITENPNSKIENIDTTLPNTIFISGDNTPTGEFWLGSDLLWNTIFSKVSLKK